MAKTEAPKALNTWYDVVAATRETLPWQEDENGVLVLGETFAVASEQVLPAQAPRVAAPLPQPTPTPIERDADTAEQAYGRLVHQLLQGLPLNFKTPESEQALADAERIRQALPWLWNEGSRAEVAMVLENGTIGRADRLVPHEGVWWVIDFKTGVPQRPVPAAYALQLQQYAQTLRASLPEAVIKTAIVWVATATLAETAWNG